MIISEFCGHPGWERYIRIMKSSFRQVSHQKIRHMIKPSPVKVTTKVHRQAVVIFFLFCSLKLSLFLIS